MKLWYMDCETTGLDPISDGMIQVAGIIEVDGEVVEEFEIKCRPFKGEFVSQSALKVNGVALEDLRTWPEPSEAYSQLKKILDKHVNKYEKKDKLYAVGQNVGFDVEFLRWFFRKNKDNYFGSYVHYHKIDLIAITTIMKIAGKIKLDNMKLESVMKALDFGDQTHDALDDVRAVRKVFYQYVAWVKGLES